MSLARKTKSPKTWKKSSYERFKKPSRKKRGSWAKQRPKNEPLGKKIFKNLARRRKQKKRKGTKIKYTPLLKSLFVFFLFAFLTGTVLAVGALAWYGRDLPDPNKLYDRSLELSTKIYDRTGKHLLYEIHGDQKRTLVPLEEIPPEVIKATLTLEDQNFYKHQGFSLWGMFRGVIISQLKGKRAQGGSTISQQLIKNTILSNERTISRKIKELVLAYRLEKKYSKDEILQLYFNEISYGSTAYGIESASQTYFGKHVQELSLAEAALLASLPKAPTYFSPYGNHTDELFWRQHYALDEMVKLGYISEKEAQRAKNEKLEFKQKIESIAAPHFVIYVKEILTKKYGEKLVEKGGLRVYTTLDLEKQKAAEEAIAQGMKKIERYGGSNAALAAVDPKNGQILAMVGSRDYFDKDNDGNVNVTTRPRQPGSSFKPIMYAAAFARGYTPQTVLYDVVTTFKTATKDYRPKNYDLKEHGAVTIKKALAGSLNIPAVKTIYLTGIERVLDLADKLGYTTFTERSRFGLSLVLGGGEVKLLEHVAAFGALANGGKLYKTTPVLKIEDKDGKILEEYREEKKQVLDKNIAAQITDILSDDQAREFVFGAGGPLTLPDRPTAAKTGTTNDYRDAWTIGYTPSLAAGVWVGNNDNSEMKQGAAGGVVAAPLWNAFMKKALAESPVENFDKPRPEENINKAVLSGGENFGEEIIQIDKFSGKLATEFTPWEAIIEKKFRTDHSILYYLDRDNPRGPQPKNPENDTQYENWEAAVKEWAEKQGFEREEPPIAYDELHQPGQQPTIKITGPELNQKITDRNINFEVETQAPRGVAKVKYFIDNKLVGTAYNSPFNLNYRVSGFENGFHNLKTVAYDDILNNNQDEITLNFMLPDEEISISWLGPKNNSQFYATSFPLMIDAVISQSDNVEAVDFYLEDSFGNEKPLGTKNNPEQQEIKIQWAAPPPAGIYNLVVEIKEKAKPTYEAGRITITVL